MLRSTLSSLMLGHEPGRSCYRHAKVPVRSLLLMSEGSHVDGEPVLHIRLHQSLVGLVDLLDGNHFDIGSDVVRAAKVEHLLGLRDDRRCSSRRGCGGRR